MIIGNGMIANYFRSKNNIPNDCVYYCAGVSDPNENHNSAFEYEQERMYKFLKSESNSRRQIIYFSSFHLNSGISSAYVSSKKIIESMLQGHGNSLIIRLPSVIPSDEASIRFENKTTILPFFYDKFVSNHDVIVHNGVSRCFVTLDDVHDFINNHVNRINETRLINFTSTDFCNVNYVSYILSHLTNSYSNIDTIDSIDTSHTYGNVKTVIYNRDIRVLLEEYVSLKSLQL